MVDSGKNVAGDNDGMVSREGIVVSPVVETLVSSDGEQFSGQNNRMSLETWNGSGLTSEN